MRTGASERNANATQAQLIGNTRAARAIASNANATHTRLHRLRSFAQLINLLSQHLFAYVNT
jgi:hypothetical protein